MEDELVNGTKICRVAPERISVLDLQVNIGVPKDVIAGLDRLAEHNMEGKQVASTTLQRLCLSEPGQALEGPW